jgi:drug/metabolite transporter (DMT)-like permease
MGSGAWRETAAFALLTLIWGTTWAAIRVALTGIPPLAGVAIRFLIAGTILLAVARIRGLRLGLDPRERRLWLFNAVATFVVPYSVIYWAEQRVPSGLSSVLFATFPLWVVLIGLFALPGERAGTMRLAGVVLGFLGVAVIFSDDLVAAGAGGIRWPGLALLGASAVSASGSVGLRRWAGGVSPLSLAAVPMLLAGAVTGGAALIAERGRALELSTGPILATLYLAAFGSALTFSVYFWLLARRTAVSAALVSYTAPVVAVLVGTLVLDEPFTSRMALGALLVLVGVAVALGSRGGTPRRDKSAALR